MDVPHSHSVCHSTQNLTDNKTDCEKISLLLLLFRVFPLLSAPFCLLPTSSLSPFHCLSLCPSLYHWLGLLSPPLTAVIR